MKENSKEKLYEIVEKLAKLIITYPTVLAIAIFLIFLIILILI